MFFCESFLFLGFFHTPMHHTARTILVIVSLVSLTGILGLLVSYDSGFLWNSLRGSAQLTGGAVAAAAEEPDCSSGSCTPCRGFGCTIACSSDEDCNDRNPATEDICRNPGTTSSLCVNRR